MEKEFFTFLSLCYNLIFLNKVEHRNKGPSMHPHTNDLDHDTSLLVTDNPLRKEHSQTPIPNNNDGLKRQCNKMKPGQKQLRMKFTLILMQEH